MPSSKFARLVIAHPCSNSAASYAMWKKWNEGTVARNGWAGFDGIDWDMEGELPVLALFYLCLEQHSI